MGLVLDDRTIDILNRYTVRGMSSGLGTLLDNAYAGIPPTDGVDDTMIDFGTGAGEISAADIPVADAGNHYVAGNVEAALTEVMTRLKAVADGLAGADFIGMTPIAETGVAATVQSVAEALITRLKAIADGLSGADLIGATAIANFGAGATVQAILEGIDAKFTSVVDGSAGADYVAATAIPALGAAATVQSQMEAVVALKKTVPHNIFRGGDLTASVNIVVGYASAAGNITRAGFTLAQTGADAADDLFLEGDFQIGGVSIHTVKPKLDKTAADGADTFTAGAGVTVGTINAAADDVALNSPITFVGTLTRTTPETEMADLTLYAEIAY